jgi:hypothetical protein
MGYENKDDGVGDPIKMFLKESLMQQRKTSHRSFDGCPQEKHIIRRPCNPLQGTSNFLYSII